MVVTNSCQIPKATRSDCDIIGWPTRLSISPSHTKFCFKFHRVIENSLFASGSTAGAAGLETSQTSITGRQNIINTTKDDYFSTEINVTRMSTHEGAENNFFLRLISIHEESPSRSIDIRNQNPLNKISRIFFLLFPCERLANTNNRFA